MYVVEGRGTMEDMNAGTLREDGRYEYRYEPCILHPLLYGQADTHTLTSFSRHYQWVMGQKWPIHPDHEN
jgi:hypothetical protein